MRIQLDMLIFKKLSYKNFLSSGNSPITIELNKTKSTQIVGFSGHGKSSVCDAICFSLFGKAFRNINKNQLINSINGKHCIVEIEFTNNQHEYKVIRGIKPTLFEIYCDGVLLNQDASSRDYQNILEQQILKLNYKVFCQSVILGSASFVPFMQLTAAQRREVIEDILDIRVFSLMNQLLKNKIQENKDNLSHIDEQIEVYRVKTESQKKLIDKLNDIRFTSIDKLDEQVKVISTTINRLNELINEKQSLVNKLLEARGSSDKQLKSDLRKCESSYSSVKVSLKRLNDHIVFLQENSTCPTCSQSIDDEHKQQQIDLTNTNIIKQEKILNVAKAAIDTLTKKLDDITNLDKEIYDYNQEIMLIQQKISLLNEQSITAQREMQLLSIDTGNIDNEKKLLKDYLSVAIELVNKKSDYLNSRQLFDAAALLLKDTGVKTAIIKEYLPIINHLINHYLHALDLFIQFELDEAFSEKIKSRHRDEFSYSSFSEGEKARINIALLFTWREIARMKNSVNTNLLIMDEVLDNSLDEYSLENFMNLIQTLRDDVNLFIISHRNTNSDSFDNVIHIKKVNDFSIVDNE